MSLSPFSRLQRLWIDRVEAELVAAEQGLLRHCAADEAAAKHLFTASVPITRKVIEEAAGAPSF